MIVKNTELIFKKRKELQYFYKGPQKTFDMTKWKV